MTAISAQKLTQKFRNRLGDIYTLEELKAWATDLYDSGLLDESEQHGDLAPWAVPDGADVIADTLEDIYIRLPSGELARWHNQDRAWEGVDSEDDIPGRYRVLRIRSSHNRDISALGHMLYASHLLAAARSKAEHLAGGHFFGVAILDGEKETIDWGDGVTDYAGGPPNE